jgi:O-antigen/teichoic acid export membrane protein
LFTNTVAIIIVKGLTMAFRILCIFVLAKTSPKEFFGLISFAVSTAEIFKVLADLGIDTFSIREFSISNDKIHKSTLSTNFAAIKFLFGSIATIILMVLALINGLNDIFAYAITIILTWTALLINLPINFFHSASRTKELLLPLIGTFLASISCVGFLWSSQINFIIIASCLPLYELLSVFILYIFLEREVQLKFNNFSIDLAKNILQKSLPVAITMIMATIYTRLDMLALNYWSNKIEMANYGIAYRVTEPFLFVGAAFSISVYSYMSNMLASASSRQKIVTSVIKNLSLALSYSVIAFLISFFLTPLSFHLFLKEYITAIPTIQILSVAMVFRVMNTALTSIIQAYGYYTLITWIATGNLILAAIMIIFASAHLNAISVSMILCATEIVNTGLQCGVLWKSLHNNLMPHDESIK